MAQSVSRWRLFFARIWGIVLITLLWSVDRVRHHRVTAVVCEAGLVLTIASLLSYFWKSKSVPDQTRK